ncbi:MAG: hypothetical protein WCC17_19120 [Candidatus Nitrosopolaris sp.]
MISTKQRTIALSAITIAAAIALFASALLVAAYQAYAFRGHGFGFGFGRFGGFGGFGWGGYDGGWGSNRCAWFGCGVGSGGWFPWGPPTPAFAG